MTRAEFRDKLQFLFEEDVPVGIKVYFILKHEEQITVKFADVEEVVRNEIKESLLTSLHGRLMENDAMVFGPLTEADERKNAVYHYDMADVPADLLCMGTALGPRRPNDEFSFADDELRDLFGFVFVLGNESQQVAVYKKHYPVSLIRRDSILGLVKFGDRFVRLTEDIIKINDTFEFLQIGTDMFVYSVKLLERFYGFDGILQREATNKISLIRAADIVENIELLEALVADKSAAKKLLRAKRSSLVLEMGIDRIRAFVQAHPKLRNRIRFNGDGDKIKFHTITSQQLFLKLLDDDFLKSDLTDSLYDSSIKENLSNDEEPDDSEAAP